MNLLNSKIVKRLISKWLMKTIRNKLACKTAKPVIDELMIDTDDDTVTIHLNASITMSKDELVELIDKKIEEL